MSIACSHPIIEKITLVGFTISNVTFALNLFNVINLYFINPYTHLTFPEYTRRGSSRTRNSFFFSVERYLNAQAKANNNDFTDEFEGAKLRWTLSTEIDRDRYFRLTFHTRHSKTMITRYLKYVISEAKPITRRRRLFTYEGDGCWTYALFDHPATFQTLAMEVHKKMDVFIDIINFSICKAFFAGVGSTWKTSYLLYGPPGTGKSTMIAAMSNLLNYNIYDIDITLVKDNTELRRLLIHTSRKSIVVIRDIDHLLEFTNESNEESSFQITLHGILKLWSECGGEGNIIVFTALVFPRVKNWKLENYVEFSYCDFEGFKVLAKNYLGVDDHILFDMIREKLEETNVTLADVAESLVSENGASRCLLRLIDSLDEAKENGGIREKARPLTAKEKKILKIVKESHKRRMYRELWLEDVAFPAAVDAWRKQFLLNKIRK